MPTQTTVPLVILIMILWPGMKGQILSAVAVMSMFTAASALNFGSVGFACWIFALLILSICKLFQGMPRWRVNASANRVSLLLVLAFVGYAFLSGIAFPFIFAGTSVIHVSRPEPLAWGMGNVAQLSYLVLSLVLYLMAVGSAKAELDIVLSWYIRACVTASCIAFYQLMSAVAHVPYPSSILYSNTSYVIFPAYKIGGLWRLNGPFTEASDMAGFLIVGVALAGWSMIYRPLSIGRTLSFATMLSALVMTQSSTGYAALVLLIVVGVFAFLIYVWRGGNVSRAKSLMALLACVFIIALLCWKPSSFDIAKKAVTATLLEKQNSDSFRERTLTHTAAMETFASTSYIGAGWGSSRASGLLYVLLANTGVVGTSLFFLMLLSFIVPLIKKRRRPRENSISSTNDRDGYSLGAIVFAIVMALSTMMAAGSELGMPILWILFGTATVATVHEQDSSAIYVVSENSLRRTH